MIRFNGKVSKVHSWDYYAAAHGYVHNIGAGGVSPQKHMDFMLVSAKRFRQYCNRTNHAIGKKPLYTKEEIRNA
jgi:hypothetical protein